MQIADVLTSGDNQMVRLPKEFYFENTTVYIYREGERVILSSKPQSWKEFFDSPQYPTEDFMSHRIDLPVQERENF